jgi:uncharacterized FAD-dependent dehydrogenase
LICVLDKYRKNFEGKPIKQKYSDYMDNRMSSNIILTTVTNAVNGNIQDLFSVSINDAIKEFVEHVFIHTMGMDASKMTLIAPELKIIRNVELLHNFEAASNLYVIGAATGKFRGILQSFCSGVRCGDNFIKVVN